LIERRRALRVVEMNSCIFLFVFFCLALGAQFFDLGNDNGDFAVLFALYIGVLVVCIRDNTIVKPAFSSKKYFGIAVILGAATAILALFLKFSIFSHSLGAETKGSLSDYYIYMLSTILLMPVVEEFFFRGILFNDLTKRFGILYSGIITAIFFMFAHLNRFENNPFFEVLSYMVPSAFLYTYLRVKTGSFYCSIAAHMTYNATLIILYSNFV
jgi:membrane protease YdiL (CAAX protease family)